MSLLATKNCRYCILLVSKIKNERRFSIKNFLKYFKKEYYSLDFQNVLFDIHETKRLLDIIMEIKHNKSSINSKINRIKQRGKVKLL